MHARVLTLDKNAREAAEGGDAPSEARERETRKDARDQFIDAALELMLEAGVDGPTVTDVCRRAGLARSTYYLHFADREDVVAAAMGRIVGGFAVETLVAAPGDLLSIFQNFIAAMSGPANLAQVAVKGTAAWRYHDTLQACAKSGYLRARYREFISEVQRTLAREIRKGQEIHAIRDDVDATAISKILVAVGFGVIGISEFEFQVDFAPLLVALARIFAPLEGAQRSAAPTPPKAPPSETPVMV
jgi:AcrR family transcriptional regulator